MNKTRLAVIALLGVGFTWGAAFVLMKDAIEQQPYMDFLGTGYSSAAIARVLVRPKRAPLDGRRGSKRRPTALSIAQSKASASTP